MGCLLTVALLLLAPTLQASADETDWDAILGLSQGSWVEPGDELVWRTDLPAALDEARETGRPLFITLRCLPCKQCADFDKDVLEGGPRLSPLLRRFVTVRLTDARQLDLVLLPAAGFQDFDLSWWGWFLSPERDVYGVFGGRDEVSDTTRISEEALARTMERVLDHHHDPRRLRWDLDGPGSPAGAHAIFPTDLPAYGSWSRQYPAAAAEACLHCHQVGELLRQPALDEGRFDKQRDLDVWPFPENAGFRVDRDDGLLVTDVTADGPAHAAGLRAGDQLRVAADRLLFGQADLRGVLHREADPSGTIAVQWLRDGERHEGQLELAEGWRSTDLTWRMSVSQGNVGAAPGFAWPLAGKHPAVPEDQLCIEPWFGQTPQEWPAYAAGLRPSHRIVAVDGERPALSGRPFLVWFRARYDPGDEVVWTVLEDGEERELRYHLPQPGVGD